MRFFTRAPVIKKPNKNNTRKPGAAHLSRRRRCTAIIIYYARACVYVRLCVYGKLVVKYVVIGALTLSAACIKKKKIYKKIGFCVSSADESASETARKRCEYKLKYDDDTFERHHCSIHYYYKTSVWKKK